MHLPHHRDHTVDITHADLSLYSMDRMERELRGIQNSLEMLFTKNNSLEGLDITEGGGSPEDQAEYMRLMTAEKAIVAEINKRHMLDQIA